MKEAPEKIYLQIVEGEENEQVTWCADRINESDIEYIRVPKVETEKNEDL